MFLEEAKQGDLTTDVRRAEVMQLRLGVGLPTW